VGYFDYCLLLIHNLQIALCIMTAQKPVALATEMEIIVTGQAVL
jgi:hypothetical protein